MDEKKCPKCGNEFSNECMFCGFCGTELGNNPTIKKKNNKIKHLIIPIVLIISIIFFIIIISQSCSHEWQPATCTTPELCIKCNKTKGETIDHEWIDATCTEAKKCSICNIQDGEKLGHNWQGGSCTEASYCSRCLISDNKPLGHKWVEATYDTPKTCTVCGHSEGSKLINYQGSTKYVVESYNAAIEYAKENGYDSDYAYNNVQERLVKINSACYINDTDEAQWQAFNILSGDIDKMSCTELQQKTQDVMIFIVPDKSDRLSALMKKFKKMSSVSGTINSTEIDIVVEDMDSFIKELGLTDKAIGGILAFLNIYDYSWVDSNSENALHFTETGFTFKWKAIGEYSLTLN